MSELATEEVDVKSEVKKAIIMGDMHKAEKLIMTNPEAFSQMERIQLLEQIKKTQFGTTNPELMALAAKM